MAADFGFDALAALLQMADSAFPVGTFSFSNGLESAAHTGLVHDASTLEQFARSAGLQAAFTDGIAALHAFRAARSGNYEEVGHADRALLLCKLNDEARLMLSRMGRKLAELAERVFAADVPAPLLSRWRADIEAGTTPGLYPVGQGLLAALAGADERGLFTVHHYGVVNMVLSAALRCVRVSHFDTQAILHRLMGEAPALYAETAPLSLADMRAFAPELDVMAGLHEKGSMRMFMN